IVPMNGFPQSVQILGKGGETVKTIADLPSREGVPINGVETGPRGTHWRPDQPNTILWAEALDGGDSKAKVPFRDKVMALGGPFMQRGDYVCLVGEGATPERDRRFLDKLDLKTLQSERLFRSSSESLEQFVAPMDDDMSKFITRYETQKEPPNYYIRTINADTRMPITSFQDPQPQVRAV